LALYFSENKAIKICSHLGISKYAKYLFLVWENKKSHQEHFSWHACCPLPKHNFKTINHALRSHKLTQTNGQVRWRDSPVFFVVFTHQQWLSSRTNRSTHANAISTLGRGFPWEQSATKEIAPAIWIQQTLDADVEMSNYIRHTTLRRAVVLFGVYVVRYAEYSGLDSAATFHQLGNTQDEKILIRVVEIESAAAYMWEWVDANRWYTRTKAIFANL